MKPGLTNEQKISLLKGTIQEEIDQLERWAYESRKGSYSTHQVEPMQRRASVLREILFDIEEPKPGIPVVPWRQGA